MAFHKHDSDHDTAFDLAAEIHSSDGDIEALMGAILHRGKALETARASFLKRAENPRNITMRPHLVAKAREAQASKKRCDLVLHTLMHKVRAPGLSQRDWHQVEPVLSSTRRAG